MSANAENSSSMAVTAGDHAFRVGGEEAAIYAGELHYWRLDRGRWETILDRMKGMGLTTASIYIPWEAQRSSVDASTSARSSPPTTSTPS